MHEVECVIDLIKSHGVCYELIHQHLAATVVLHKLRHTLPTLPTWAR